MKPVLTLYTEAVEIYKTATGSEQEIDFLLDTDNLDEFLINAESLIDESQAPVEAYLLKEKRNVEELLAVFDLLDSCMIDENFEVDPIFEFFLERLQNLQE